MTDTNTPTADETLDFEQSMQALEQLVVTLENGELSLEDSLAAFERGIALTKRCQQQLEQANQKVSLLVGEADALTLEAFDSPNG